MTVVPENFVPGLDGVVAFTTEIAEPDKDGGALRYRGVDIEDLVSQRVTFGDVWALLVDGNFGSGLPPAEPFPLPIHSGDVRVDVQAGLAMLAPIWGYAPLLDIDDATARQQLARASVMALSYVAQSARGIYQPAVPQRIIDECSTVTARFMTRWQGEPDPRHIEAIDAYWVSAAEHGMNASTFTARVIASTGADVAAALSGAIGAMSGPLHGGAPARVLPMMLPGSTCRTPTCGTLAPGIAANELADPPNGEHASTGESVLEELGSVGAAEPIAWVVTAAPTPRTTANAPTWPMRLA